MFDLQIPSPISGLKRLLHRGSSTKPLVASWQDTPYGQLSEGLFWEAYNAWKTHTRLKRLWGVLHYALGVLGIALAGLAGFGGLSKLLGYQQAALIAIGSGIATGLVVFLKSDEKRRQQEELAVSWDNLKDDVTTLYVTRPGGGKGSDPNGSRAVMDALMERAKSLREGKATSNPPAAWPSRTARNRRAT